MIRILTSAYGMKRKVSNAISVHKFTKVGSVPSPNSGHTNYRELPTATENYRQNPTSSMTRLF